MTVQTFSVPVEPIPATHQVGDPNHTPDHNSIVQVLTDYDNYIGQLQSQIASMFSVAGGNVCNITGTSTPLATVNLPAGNRDSAVDTLDVMCAGVKVFSLNGYGELRIFPQLASHIAQVIKAQPSQTGDLFQLQDSAGNVLARFTANGTLLVTQPVNIVQPGTTNTPENWHTISGLSSGWSIGSGPAGFLKYKKLPSNSVAMAMRNVRVGTNADSTTILSAGTIPAGWAPISISRIPVYTDVLAIASGTAGNNAEMSIIQVNPDGSAQCYGFSSAATRVDCAWGQYALDL